jgi:hypothetical protein
MQLLILYILRPKLADQDLSIVAHIYTLKRIHIHAS